MVESLKTAGEKLPVWFWIVSTLALAWNLMGFSVYVSQVMMTAEQIQALPEQHQQLIANTPYWVTSLFAIAVTAGVLGCVLLLLKRRLAVPVFIVSLLCILGHDIYWIVLRKGYEIFEPTALVMTALVVVIAIGLIFFSRMTSARGWLH